MRDPEQENYLLQHGTAFQIVAYMSCNGVPHSKEWLDVVLRKAVYASDLYRYAHDIAKCRVPEIEAALVAFDATFYMAYYAETVAKGRVPEFEEALSRNRMVNFPAYLYLLKVAKCRIPSIEAVLGIYANDYAEVIRI